MKGGARLRLDLDEGWCETLHYITIHNKRIDLDEGWCETLHYITIHQKRIDLDEGWCETLHYITIHHKRIDLDEGWCETLHYITIHQKRIDLDEGWCETLHYITIHHKRTDLDEGWCETHCNGCMNVAWAMFCGESRSTKPCVFPCKVAAGDDERYLVCATGAAAVVPDAIGSFFYYVFCNRWLFLWCSSMRFLKLWLQIAL